jgi:integrase
VNKWTIESNWQRIRVKAGLGDVRIHDLRHTVGTHAGAAGLGHYAVRDLLGHKTLAMSNRYVQTDIAPARRAADQATARIAAALIGPRAPAKKHRRRQRP